MTEILSVTDVHGGYGDTPVLAGVDLKVDSGEIVALLGPNGHGKSTLLKAISGVHPASAGTVLFDGEDVTHRSAHHIVETGIAYIPEERYLFDDMTVLDNLYLGAYNRSARDSRDQNLERVFQVFPRLKQRQSQICGTMSGGEARMVAIARGLMSSSRLLLVDEPSIGLSPGMKKGVYEAIERIQSEIGITILLVEQEIDYALRLASRLYLFKRGRVEFERTTAEASVDEIHEAYF